MMRLCIEDPCVIEWPSDMHEGRGVAKQRVRVRGLMIAEFFVEWSSMTSGLHALA
jgi:hypothetical protein